MEERVAKKEATIVEMSSMWSRNDKIPILTVRNISVPKLWEINSVYDTENERVVK